MGGFQIPLAGFRIPKPWIPDSTDQNCLDCGFRITLHGAICKTVKCNGTVILHVIESLDINTVNTSILLIQHVN